MRSTLFYIPHTDPMFGIPVFGWGLLAALLIAVGVVAMLLRVRQDGWKWEVLHDVPLYLLLIAAVVWGAPLVEERTAAGTPLGIPVRGYGVMVLLGIVTSAALLIQQSRRMGLHADLMLSLVFWMVVCGFVGARLFYVIQYWPQFSAPTWPTTLLNVARLTDGGLVVYGSFMGGAAAVLWFARRYQLPVLAIGDLLAPSMMLGLAFGRIGCFLNGCCWGGQCDPSALGVTFPQGSPPFVDQVKNGTLLDMRLERQPDDTYHVRDVEAGGLAARAGLQPGDEILQITLPEEDVFNRLRHGEEANAALLSLTLSDGRRISWELGDIPRRSAPVYPVQVFSSINAALICLFLWSSYPFRRRDGEVLAWMLTLYPITRFLLELIRSDEASVLETGFKITISQSISLVLLVVVTGLWIYLLRQPRGSALPLAAADGNDHAPQPAGSPSSL